MIPHCDKGQIIGLSKQPQQIRLALRGCLASSHDGTKIKHRHARCPAGRRPFAIIRAPRIRWMSCRIGQRVITIMIVVVVIVIFIMIVGQYRVG